MWKAQGIYSREETDAWGKALLLCDKCYFRGRPKEIWDQCGKNDLFHLESWGEFHSGVTYELDLEVWIMAPQNSSPEITMWKLCHRGNGEWSAWTKRWSCHWMCNRFISLSTPNIHGGTWIHLICLFFLRSFRFTVKLRDTESFHILSLLWTFIHFLNTPQVVLIQCGFSILG